MNSGDFLYSFVGIFVAMDVVGTLPMYVQQTTDFSGKERVRVVNTSIAVAFVVALLFLFLGDSVFKYLGITMSDFKISGGIVLLLISLFDLLGSSEVKSRASGQTGVVPLAVPLITGPAVITTLIYQGAHLGYTVTLGALTLNYLIAWQCLAQSVRITHFIGRDGTVVVSKIAALLLAAIAVSMIRGGIFELIRA